MTECNRLNNNTYTSYVYAPATSVSVSRRATNANTAKEIYQTRKTMIKITTEVLFSDVAISGATNANIDSDPEPLHPATYNHTNEQHLELYMYIT